MSNKVEDDGKFAVRVRVDALVLKQLAAAGLEPIVETPKGVADKPVKPSLGCQSDKGSTHEKLAIEGGAAEQSKDCDRKGCSDENPFLSPPTPKELGRRSRRRS